MYSDERKHDGGEALSADPWPEAGNAGTICPSKPAGQGRLPQHAAAFGPGKRQLDQHSMWAMPSYPLPGFNIPTPQHSSQAARGHPVPPYLHGAALQAAVLYQRATSASPADVMSVSQLQSEVGDFFITLTDIIRRRPTRGKRPTFPERTTRAANGQPICFKCGRIG